MSDSYTEDDCKATQLDCLVADKIMGWRLWKDKELDQVVIWLKGDLSPWGAQYKPDRKRFEKVAPAKAARMEFCGEAPKFSRNMEAAWEVVKKMSRWGNFSLNKVGNEWAATFGVREATAKTAAKAICLAALMKPRSVNRTKP